MNTNIKAGVAGRYRIDTVNADTGEVREVAPWFDNLILDAGLNRIGTGLTQSHCVVGSGSAAPQASDTTLGSLVASTTTIQSGTSGTQSSAPYFGWTRRTYRFAAGAAAGNLAEVGIGWGPSNLFSRALITDQNGNPTTITVLSNEYLDVTYEFRLYPPLTDSTFTCVVGGVTHNCVLRAADVTYLYAWSPFIYGYEVKPGNANDSAASAFRVYNGALGSITQNPSGTSTNPDTVVPLAYSNNSRSMQCTASFGLNTGNLSGGITSIAFGTYLGRYQCSFSPAIDKTTSKTLTLNFSVTWARKSI